MSKDAAIIELAETLSTEYKRADDKLDQVPVRDLFDEAACSSDDPRILEGLRVAREREELLSHLMTVLHNTISSLEDAVKYNERPLAGDELRQLRIDLPCVDSRVEMLKNQYDEETNAKTRNILQGMLVRESRLYTAMMKQYRLSIDACTHIWIDDSCTLCGALRETTVKYPAVLEYSGIVER